MAFIHKGMYAWSYTEVAGTFKFKFASAMDGQHNILCFPIRMSVAPDRSDGGSDGIDGSNGLAPRRPQTIPPALYGALAQGLIKSIIQGISQQGGSSLDALINQIASRPRLCASQVGHFASLT